MIRNSFFSAAVAILLSFWRRVREGQVLPSNQALAQLSKES